MCTHTHTHTHTHTLNGPFSGTTWVSHYQKDKPIWILLKQETVSGRTISWDICKSATHSRQITTPAPHHSDFLQAGCPSCRPTNSVKALKVQECPENQIRYTHTFRLYLGFTSPISATVHLRLLTSQFYSLQCFDAVGWVAGRASGLQKTEWWGAGVIICLERDADLHMTQLMPLPLTVSHFS